MNIEIENFLGRADICQPGKLRRRRTLAEAYRLERNPRHKTLSASEKREALAAIRKEFPWKKVRAVLIKAGVIEQRRPRSAARRRKRAR